MIMHSSLETISIFRRELMGIAILWIMLRHLPISSGYYYVLDYLMNLGYGGVDMFLFLSGFGLFFSMKKDSRIGSFY